MKIYYVYILKCDNKSYYVWVTNNLERRFEEHKHSKNIYAYTSMNDSLELVYHEECSDVRDAIAREKQLKWWSRKKKELLIDWNIEWLIKYGSDA